MIVLFSTPISLSPNAGIPGNHFPCVRSRYMYAVFVVCTCMTNRVVCFGLEKIIKEEERKHLIDNAYYFPPIH